jgi:dihydrofolate reductase
MYLGKKIAEVFTSPATTSTDGIVVGDKDGIPWMHHTPSHFERLAKLVEGQSVLIGNKTWKLGFLNPFLKKSQVLVLTQKPKEFPRNLPSVIAVDSLETATKFTRSETLWVLGGAFVFGLTIEKADFLHQTMISERFPGNAFFPSYKKEHWGKCENFAYLKARSVDCPKDELDSQLLVFRRIIH